MEGGTLADQDGAPGTILICLLLWFTELRSNITVHYFLFFFINHVIFFTLCKINIIKNPKLCLMQA